MECEPLRLLRYSVKHIIVCSATFYTQNGNAGACGDKHPDSDIICALETATYAGGSHCGQYVDITNVKTGKTVKVLVADVRVLCHSVSLPSVIKIGECIQQECPTCKNKQSIDLSTGAFQALGGTVNEGIFDSQFFLP